MIRAEGQRLIRAPLDRVYGLVSRVEHHPRYADIWLAADVLDRKSNALQVHYRGYLAGLPVESIHRITLRPRSRVEFRQTRGTLKAFRGEYTLAEAAGETRLTYLVEVEAGVALLSEAAVRQAIHAHVERMLNRVKAAAERDLVRVIRRSRPPRAEGEEVAPVAGEEEGEAEPAAPDIEIEEEEGPAPPESAAPAAGPSPPSQPAPPGPRRRRRRRRRRPAVTPPPAAGPPA